MPNRDYDELRLIELRQAGQLICRCPVPSLEWLGVWDCYQCRRCGKLVDR